MPKKSASARASTQRAKQKTQKNFELVRPIEDESPSTEEDLQQPISTPTTASITKPLVPSNAPSSPVAVEASPVSSAPASAATRLAARRQSQQRQQRSTSSLITAEHYSYVRKDLLYIAILAVIMLTIIIVLYFMIGINA